MGRIKKKPCSFIAVFLGFVCLIISNQNCTNQNFDRQLISSSTSLNKTDDSPLTQKISAATLTANSNSDCVSIGDFYWEIGDASGVLGSGSIGTSYGATTEIPIASSSKIVFGAFMLQKTGGTFTDIQKRALRMQSGYYGLNPAACAPSATVYDCLNAGVPGPNYKFDSTFVDRFNYDGAHDQMYATTALSSGGLGIGSYTTDQVNSLIMGALGNPGFKYKFPEFAGGITASASQFGVFLRRILSKNLNIYYFLGADPVCTLPGPSCPTAIGSPSPFAWHYSYNHWVEDDPEGDGSFSSAGAFGFYPWISSDKTLYGIVSRNGMAGTAIGSVQCGQKIRLAWKTGIPQI